MIGRILRFIIKALIIPILSSIRHFCGYKICLMRTNRLGHLSCNTQLFFIRQRLGLLENLNYYLIAPSVNSKQVANKELLMLHVNYSKRVKKVRIIMSSFLYSFFHYSEHLFIKKNFFMHLEYKSKESEFLMAEETVRFSNEQEKIGNEILSKMMVSQNDKIVSIYTRDSSYLDNKYKNIDWSYHDYRNTNIKIYIKAIKYLIKEGYKVIRIGSEFSKSLGLVDDYFFEYNLSEYKSGLMDLFIPYKSNFIIGCKSGATDISLLFQTPLLVTDLTAFMEIPLGKNDLFIQKKIFGLNNEIIPFKEIISKDQLYTHNGNEFQSKYKMKYIDNTEEEILSATKEMNHRINNNFELTNTQKALLRRYHVEYCKKNKFTNMPAPISISWLENNSDLYLD